MNAAAAITHAADATGGHCVKIRNSPAWMHVAALFALSAFAFSAQAAKLSLTLDGVDAEIKDAAVAATGIGEYASQDITAAQAHRLYDKAPARIADALEPYGYYNSKTDGELNETPQGWTIVLHVHPGEPTIIAASTLEVPDPARDEKSVRKAIATFAPKQGQRLDHAAYERSKATVQAALLASGYLDAKITAHRIEVSRADNRATLKLVWEPGQRYRYGITSFSGGQFDDGFLDRYLPWHQGDFYSQGQLLQLQQKLVDADYFAVVEVQPDMEHAKDGVVPITVVLGPALRNIYTAGVFIDTDIGFGVRAGMTRRWVNSRGHKLKLEAVIAQRMKSASATYSIPLPGENDRSYNLGANYLDENTDTTQSHTESLVANETRQWLGFTRTLGLKLLTGTFTILDQNGNHDRDEHGNTTLLYPEVSLEKKQADDPLFVRDGYSLTLAARGSPGFVSATSFVQARADAKWIKGIGNRQRIIVRGSLGATQVDDFDKLPPDLRFFAGGDRSIRGYSYQTIGPHDAAGLVIGGQNLAVVSGEYEYYFTHDWGVATFVDAGDAFTGFGTFKTRIGTGLGLRWRSPVGMVRMDLGTPIHDPDGESGIELHLAIGPDL
jgi:translocation and assembly module TamA